MEKSRVQEINKLISQIAHGDENSVCTLYEIMSPTLRYIALKYLRNEHDASDLVQDFWADIVKISQKFHFFQNGFSYLSKVLTNMAINRYYAINKDKKATAQFVDYTQISSFDDEFDKKQLRYDVSIAISKLTDIEKIIIQETYFGQKTIRQIAKELKISKSKAFNLKKSALEFLKKELEHIHRG